MSASTDFIQGQGNGTTSTKDFQGSVTTDRGSSYPVPQDYIAHQFNVTDLTDVSGTVLWAPSPYLIEFIYATDEANEPLIPAQPMAGTQITQSHWLRIPVFGNQFNAAEIFSGNTQLGTQITGPLPSAPVTYDGNITVPNGGISGIISTPQWLQKPGTYAMQYGASVYPGIPIVSGAPSSPLSGSTVKIYYISKAGATLVGTINDALVLDAGGTFNFTAANVGFFRFVFSNIGVIGPNATVPGQNNGWQFALESTGYTP